MYASKARGGHAFFAGAVTTPQAAESNISVNHGAPVANPFISSFEHGEIQNMSNAIASLQAAQSRVKSTLSPFDHTNVMGDDGEHISVSSSSYGGIKRSHDSMTTTSTGIPPSSQSLPPPSQSTAPSSDPSNPSESNLPPTSPPKKRSRGSKASDIIAPPSRAQKEKITTAVAVNGMQGTINRMTDMLANVLDPNALATAFVTASSASAPSTSNTSGPAQPPATAGSSTASSDKRKVLKHLKQDDSLAPDEKFRLLNIFTKNPDSVETYLEVIDDDVLRLGYARELLKDI
jgi:hypothetical protein